VNAPLTSLSQLSRDLENQTEVLTTEQSERKLQEQRQLKQHAELQKTVEELGETLRKESHADNCSLSELDDAKLQLKLLMLTIEGYRDNLETQKLLEAEHENRKGHAMINNERESLSRTRDTVEKKGKESEAQIAALTERIATVNQQIYTD
jgi:hypothetical protein